MPGGRLDFGQEVTCRVTYLREDGRINVSMRLQKENALVADAQDIYDFLVKRNGSMLTAILRRWRLSSRSLVSARLPSSVLWAI